MEGQPPVTSHTAEAIFLQHSTPLHTASAWGKQQPHPQESLSPQLMELKLGCCGVQLESLSLIKANRKPAGKDISLGDFETLADLALGTVLVKAGLGAQLGFSLHTRKSSRRRHKLWIPDSSKQVVQGQSQAVFDICYTRIFADLPNRQKQTHRGNQNEKTKKQAPNEKNKKMLQKN